MLMLLCFSPPKAATRKLPVDANLSANGGTGKGHSNGAHSCPPLYKHLIQASHTAVL